MAFAQNAKLTDPEHWHVTEAGSYSARCETKQAGIQGQRHANIIETKSRERKTTSAAGMAGYTLIADGAGRTRGMAVRAINGLSARVTMNFFSSRRPNRQFAKSTEPNLCSRFGKGGPATESVELNLSRFPGVSKRYTSLQVATPTAAEC